MQEWWQPLGRAGVPVTAALVGGAVGAVGAGRREPATTLMLHFAAGAFLAVAVAYLIPEATRQAGWPVVILAVIAGWALPALAARRTGSACPACATGHGDHSPATGSGAAAPENEAHSSALAPVPLGLPLLLVVGLHSLLDGVALAGGAGGHHEAELLSLAVLAHKVPEGMAIAAICRSGGLNAGKALGVTALVEACTFAGVALALFAGMIGQPLLGAALGVVAGSFLYLVRLSLASIRRGAHPLLSTAAAAAGLLLVAAARAGLGAE